MGYLFILIAILSMIYGLKLVIRSIWGRMPLRKGALFTFLGYALFSASLFIADFGLNINKSGWNDSYWQAIQIYPLFLGFSLFAAVGFYLNRRWLRWMRNKRTPKMAWWIDSDLDVPD